MEESGERAQTVSIIAQCMFKDRNRTFVQRYKLIMKCVLLSNKANSTEHIKGQRPWGYFYTLGNRFKKFGEDSMYYTYLSGSIKASLTVLVCLYVHLFVCFLFLSFVSHTFVVLILTV